MSRSRGRSVGPDSPAGAGPRRVWAVRFRRVWIAVAVWTAVQLTWTCSAVVGTLASARGAGTAASSEDAEGLGRRLRSAADGIDQIRRGTALPPLSLLPRLPGVPASVGEGLDLLPSAAGVLRLMADIIEPGAERTWLVGLQNPAELRATGGLIGSWVTVTTGAGMPQLVAVERVRSLFAAAHRPPSHVGTTDQNEQLMRTFASLSAIQNINVVPDFPIVGRSLADAYERARGANPALGPPVEGVILVDTAALVSLVRVTGPISVEGVKGSVTADRLTHLLLIDLYQQYPWPSEREVVLARLIREVWAELIDGGWTVAASTPAELTQLVERGHLQMWSGDERLQSSIRAQHLDGAWPQPTEASLGVVTQNMAATKTDQMLERRARVGIVRGRASPTTGTQSVALTLRVDIRNRAPASGLVSYILGPYEQFKGSLGPGDNRQLYSVYTSVPWTDIRVDGRRVASTSFRDGRWWVATVPVDIRQGGSARLEVTARGEIDAATSDFRFFRSVDLTPLPVTVDVQDAAGHRRSSSAEVYRSAIFSWGG